MRKIILLLAILLTTSPCFCVDDLIDFDTSILDTPFSSNRRAVTQDQFNRALEQKQQRSKGLIQKFREFLGKNKIENDPNLKNFKSDSIGEMGQLAQDIEDKKPSLLISVPLLDSFGKTIPVGHYQTVISKKDDLTYIDFLQGSKIYGSIKAVKSTDDWDSNAIIYSRIIYKPTGVAIVIFSNLDDCYKGFTKIVPPIAY